LADHLAGQAIDRLIGAYLILSAGALIFPHRPPGWPLFLIAHVAAAALLLSGAVQRARRAADPGHGENPGGRGPDLARKAARTLVDWYPLLILPGLYWELPFLNAAIWDGHFFDAVVLGWEQAVFGGQPSMTLAQRWSSTELSEVLHLAYLSYFVILYAFPATLYLSARRTAYQHTIFALMLTAAVHYVVFVTFPVQGPRYLFPPPGGPLASGRLYGLTHAVLEAGSSRGAAFPSAHAALATVLTGSAIRHAPALAPLIGAATVGIALGAVYGGFHYATDVTVGVLVGAVATLAAPRARRWLGR
jgi:membrane-associated phospholipid phosphatase